jgi:hypothetical protein
MKIRNGKIRNNAREIPGEESEEALVKFTYFGKHFKTLPVVIRNIKITITSGSDNSIKNQGQE